MMNKCAKRAGLRAKLRPLDSNNPLTLVVESQPSHPLSNRPHWTAFARAGLPGKPPRSTLAFEGISPAENVMSQVSYKERNRGGIALYRTIQVDRLRKTKMD